MIDVLLSTYNGEAYIKELLDSLLNQSYKDIRILIRDDGSKDNTFNIILDYAKDNPNITIIKDELGNIGSTKSFLKLLSNSSAEYIAFCDQDDVWVKDKIETCIEELTKHDTATLLFSDLELIDINNKTLYDSYFLFMNRNPYDSSFKTILQFRGIIPGCSMVFNRQLKDLVLYKNIDNIDFHDLYLSYIAATLGKIVYIDKCLVKYRQTGKNQVGANNDTYFKVVLKNLKSYNHTKKTLSLYIRSYISLCEFRDNYLDKLSTIHKDELLYEIENDKFKKYSPLKKFILTKRKHN